MFKQFLNKWRENVNKLESHEELWKFRWAVFAAKIIVRGSVIVAAVLNFINYSAIGGLILTIYTFLELVISSLENHLRKKKEKWNEFSTDAKTFLDNFHGLLGISERIAVSKFGKENETCKNLRNWVKAFLQIYDRDDDGLIDVEELIVERKYLNQGKDANLLGKMVIILKKLEEEIINYQQNDSSFSSKE